YLPKKDQIESNHAAGARRAAPVDGPTQSAQVAGMADTSANSPRLPPSAHAAGPSPVMQLEVRHGTARPLLYTVTDAGFLSGRVAGCDLRLPGVDLPPVICLLARQPGGVGIRKLVPAYPMTVNGQAATTTALADGDRVRLGPVELVLHLSVSPH